VAQKPARIFVSVTDKALTSSVEASAQELLGRSPHQELHGIRCSFFEGVLVLTGTVSTFFLWHTAQSALQGVRGVELIDNRLVVTRPSFAWQARRMKRVESLRRAKGKGA
jgi:osmotically-inducible protein OsmY